MPVTVVVFYVLAAASAVLAIIVALFARTPFAAFCRETSVQGWCAVTLAALLRLAISCCFFFAVMHAPRIEAAVLTLTWPLFFILFSVLFNRYRINWTALILLGVSLAGVVLIIAGEGASADDPASRTMAGLLVALAAAVIGGLHSYVYKQVFQYLSLPNDLTHNILMVFFVSIIGTLLMCGPAFWLGEAGAVSPRADGALLLVLLGVFAYAGVQQILYYFALMSLDEAELANIQYLHPVAVTLMLALLAGDSFGRYFVPGALLVFASQWALQATNQKQRTHTSH